MSVPATLNKAFEKKARSSQKKPIKDRKKIVVVDVYQMLDASHNVFCFFFFYYLLGCFCCFFFIICYDWFFSTKGRFFILMYYIAWALVGGVVCDPFSWLCWFNRQDCDVPLSWACRGLGFGHSEVDAKDWVYVLLFHEVLIFERHKGCYLLKGSWLGTVSYDFFNF